MNKRIHSGMMLTLLLLCILLLVSNSRIAQASPEPTVYVDPPSIVDPTLTPGNSLIVSLMVSNVEAEFGCYEWLVNMSFDPSILEFVDADEGDFLKRGGVTVFMWELEEGYVITACMILGVYPGVNGSGTLATIEFQVVGTGESSINIDNPMTSLFELVPSPLDLREIPCIKENGYFNNLPSSMIDGLKTEIEELSSEGEIDNHGIVTSLLAKLNAAQKLIDDGKTDQAMNLLNAFINEVQAQSGKHITQEAAELLIESAEYIISHL